MKQSAVEFLVEELKESGFNHLDLATDIIEKAKEIELQRMRSAFIGCWITNVPNGIECKVDFEKWLEKFKNK